MTSSLPEADITVNDPNWIAFARTPRVCSFFNKHAIMFQQAEILPDPGLEIYISKEGPIEEYTLFTGDFARPMGAFSYSYSPARTLGPTAGRYCSIGNSLRVMGERHPMEWVTTSNITYCFRPDWNKPHFVRAHQDLMNNRWSPLSPPTLLRPNPILAHDVWIADGVTLAAGITIETGAVIVAGAVVTKNVHSYMVVGGNPARPLRRRFSDALCEKLLISEWWRVHPDALFVLDRSNPIKFLDELEDAKGKGIFGPCLVKSFMWSDMVLEISQIPA